MRPLKGELLLKAWERGWAEATVEAALLKVACAEAAGGDVELLSMAERNLQLLHLRRITFGDLLRGYLHCSYCETRLEFEISVASMLERLEASQPSAQYRWSLGGLIFTMRPVTSRDLRGLHAVKNPRRGLLALCTSVDGDDIESALNRREDAVAEYFNRINAGAEIRFCVPCTACGATDEVDLDIARFLWTEVKHAALTLLREVHELARAYSWSERSILNMTATRRATYLEMAHS
jgi:hypothetical protein